MGTQTAIKGYFGQGEPPHPEEVTPGLRLCVDENTVKQRPKIKSVP